MRVIAGTWRGRRLLGPPRGAETRPTADRVRESLFSVLGARVEGARVLDLFAGTGAFGIEALSRGAAHATFVDVDRGLCETVQTNLEALECEPSSYAVLRRDARRPLKGAAGPFDLVFIDPPYGHGHEREALASLVSSGALSPAALVLVEHASRDPLALPDVVAAALEVVDARDYGDTAVTLLAPRDAAREADAPTEATMTRTAVYAGTFDPPTNGHFDLIRRAVALFDRVVIAVASNPRKRTLFTGDERAAMLREVLGDDPRIEVDQIEGLLVDYARARGAVAVIRGLRAVADFEYEFQMACMNRHLAPTVDTVFLMTAQEYFYVSSSLVKEVASFGGDIGPFVPATVRARLDERLRASR